MFGILTGLIFVEQRHDLTHHHIGWIISQFLRDRNQPDPLLCKTSDVEFKLEMVTEKAAEGMHNDNIEPPWFLRCCLHQLLKFRTPVICRRSTRLNENFDDLPAFRVTIRFSLPPLIGN